jgi:DNA-binding GntR family transcriptional regulator
MEVDDLQEAPIPKGRLKEIIAQRLLDEILAARIAPGAKIVEGRWAREFKVAQISVREGLNILASQGFVTKGHGRSARVLKLEDSDIVEIYQVRGVLEGLAARLIVERRLPVDDLELALSEIQQALESGVTRNVVECVRSFHMLLLEKPENAVLREQSRRLLVPLYAFTQIRAAAKKLDVTPWEKQIPRHHLIIDVLKQGNAHLAEETLIHVTNMFLEGALEVWAPH